MKTKQLTATERLLKICIDSEMRKQGINNVSATIAQKVQLISIPEFAALPKTIKIDKEACWNYIIKQGAWYDVGRIDEIPEEINTSALYIGWHYQEADKKYAVCFMNKQFWARKSGLIIADLTRMYLTEKILKEKGYKTATMHLTDDTVISAKNEIIREVGAM